MRNSSEEQQSARGRPWVGCVTAAELVMFAEVALATTHFETSHSTVTLLEFGNTRANSINNAHELMTKDITLPHT